jgi:hypothetical protein
MLRWRTATSGHWDEIAALRKLNSIPFNATGEKIRESGLWCVYEFTWQLDAIQFWDVNRRGVPTPIGKLSY